jgi:hypothetical protein
LRSSGYKSFTIKAVAPRGGSGTSLAKENTIPDETTSTGKRKPKKYMKAILLLISVLTLVGTTGCFFVERRHGEGYREHGEYRHVEHPVYVEPSVDVRIHN